MNPDLRSFLADLRAAMPEQVLTIAGEVPLDYTSTALALELERRGQRPVLLFEHVAGHELRLAANLFAAREVLAAGIGATPETLVEALGEKLDALIPAEVVATGPVQEIVWAGDVADLTRLPIPRHFVEQTHNTLESLGGNVLGTCLTGATEQDTAKDYAQEDS